MRIWLNLGYFQWYFMTKSQYNVNFLFIISQIMYLKSNLVDYARDGKAACV